MRENDTWTSTLHNLTRTEKRQQWRFEDRHVSDVGVPERSGPSLGVDMLVERFAEQEAELLQAYENETDRRQRRALLLRILRVALEEELITQEQFDHVARSGPHKGARANRSQN